jgi:hypothetical protein
MTAPLSGKKSQEEEKGNLNFFCLHNHECPLSLAFSADPGEQPTVMLR